MRNFTQKDIKTMFSQLCCSRCKNEFEKASIEIIKKYGDTMLCKLTCKKCGKDFGQIVLNFNKKSDKHQPLTIIEGYSPITSDDVIDAHNFIKKNL